MKKNIYFIIIIIIHIIGYYMYKNFSHDFLDFWLHIFYYTVFGMLFFLLLKKRKKMIEKSKIDLEKALRGDGTWDIKSLEDVSKNTLIKYKNSISKKDLLSMKDFMTTEFYNKSKKNIEKKLSGVLYVVKDIKILGFKLMSIKDSSGKNGDKFIMEIEYSMISYIIQEDTGVFLYSPDSPRWENESFLDYQNRVKNTPFIFQDGYFFVRRNGKWILEDIKDFVSMYYFILKKLFL